MNETEKVQKTQKMGVRQSEKVKEEQPPKRKLTSV